jgi:DNA polymerase-3 subunit alpha
MDMAAAAKGFGMKAVALTDHGNMYGIPEFVDSCKAVGIKPIIGSEMYMVPDIRTKAEFITPAGKKSRSGYHLVLLAKNLTGYLNLVKLTNIAHTDGFYYYPKIDWNALVAHKEGLIVSSACLSGELAQATLSGNPTEAAPPVARKFKDAFGDDYYIEVMENNMVNDVQRNVNRRVIATSKNVGIKVIPTCDTHYATPDLQAVHDVVLCVRDKKSLSDPTRFHYDGLYHLKSPEEMATLFPEYMANTLEIAEKIEDFSIYSKELRLPSAMLEPNGLLRGLAKDGLREKGLNLKPEYVDRLDRELKTIEECNFAPYFIATRNIISIINKLNCPLGWARGSAGGSLVCYVLGITDIDPIKWGLLFERFVNKTRPDQPDIDIDVPQGRRQEVVSEIFKHFGTDKVAHISTYQCFKPKMLIRDVCRILGESVATTEALSKRIPDTAEMMADIRYKKTKEGDDTDEDSDFWKMLNTLSKKDAIIKVLNTLLARDKESHKDSNMTVGAPRHIGTHASGIVISNVPIKEYLPIKMDKEKMATMYDMHYVDKFGFLKFDVLGLRTLDIIYATAKDLGIDIKAIPLDDETTYKLIADGKVIGVFQFEASKSYVQLCHKMKPANIKEIFDLCALHRPGVMDSGQLDVYLQRRAGLETVTYPHPSLKATLEASYGVCIFQEDMMKLAVEYAGYDPVEAENLRRAISKKIQAVMDTHKAKFIEKSKALGRTEVEKVWGIVNAGARYNWNKCLVGDTMISTPNGDMPIRNIKENDIVYSFNGDKFVKQRVEHNHYNGNRPTFEIRLSNGSTIQATRNHRFLTNEGYKSVNQFKVGDSIKIAQGTREFGACVQGAFNNVMTSMTQSNQAPGPIILDNSHGDDMMSTQPITTEFPVYGIGNIANAAFEVVPSENNFTGGIESIGPAQGTSFSDTTPPRRTPTPTVFQSCDSGSERGRSFNPQSIDTCLDSGGINVHNFTDDPATQSIVKIKMLNVVNLVRSQFHHIWVTFQALFVDCVEQGLFSTRKLQFANDAVVVPPFSNQSQNGRLIGSPPFAFVGSDSTQVPAQIEFHPYNHTTDVYVESITYAGYQDVWDLEMPIHHNFVANGMISHNSHAVGYGMITYASAYLSANHPLQFFKNLISMAEPDKKATYLSEAIGRKLKVLPPDVNKSEMDVTIDGDGIRLGLLSVKGIGESIAAKIMAGRPYDSIDKALAILPKSIISTMYAVRGMDSVPGHHTHSPVMKANEAELLGISLKDMTSEYTELIKKLKATPVHEIRGAGPAVIKVVEVKEVKDRRERKMAWITGIDAFGPIIEGMPMFADAYSKGKPKKGQTYAMILSALPNGGHQVIRIGTPEEVMGS